MLDYLIKGFRLTRFSKILISSRFKNFRFKLKIFTESIEKSGKVELMGLTKELHETMKSKVFIKKDIDYYINHFLPEIENFNDYVEEKNENGNFIHKN